MSIVDDNARFEAEDRAMMEELREAGLDTDATLWVDELAGEEDSGQPIKAIELPEVEVPEVLIHSGQSDTVDRGVTSLPGIPTEEVGEAEAGEVVCPWDRRPVAEAGDTCDLECWISWWGWHVAARNGRNAEILRLEPDEVPPKDLDYQPWYSGVVGE